MEPVASLGQYDLYAAPNPNDHRGKYYTSFRYLTVNRTEWFNGVDEFESWAEGREINRYAREHGII